MNRLWRKYLALLDTDFTTQVFDNIKKTCWCAPCCSRRAPTYWIASITCSWGYLLRIWRVGGLILVSAVLMLLSVSDGLRRLSKLPYHTAFQIILFLIYLVLAVRVVEIVWVFRA